MTGERNTGTKASAGDPAATRVRVEAPAKLNLLLRVLAREVSGYHAIETSFVKLELHDVVHVDTGARSRSLHCDGPSMPEGGLGPKEQNLAWRAAELYSARTGWPDEFAIRIEKHIPVGGGLGGGSADAAAVLRGLNAIAPQPLDPGALMQLGGTLGADVPFLLSDALLAWGWNHGDRLLALPSLPAVPVRLVAFDSGVHTGAAYTALSPGAATVEWRRGRFRALRRAGFR